MNFDLVLDRIINEVVDKYVLEYEHKMQQGPAFDDVPKLDFKIAYDVQCHVSNDGELVKAIFDEARHRAQVKLGICSAE